jgi:hypothetical protein
VTVLTNARYCLWRTVNIVVLRTQYNQVDTAKWRAKKAKTKAVPLHATKALDGGEWSASRPGRALTPGKGSPVPIVQEAGWAPEPTWTQRLKEKFFRLCRGPNLGRQPVARHYTVWATRPKQRAQPENRLHHISRTIHCLITINYVTHNGYRGYTVGPTMKPIVAQV